MARYIKANPKVAQYLHLENDRNQVKDGNYLLWQADMLAFGQLTELPRILEEIGGIALQVGEARQEQNGKTVRELPTATDSRFILEKNEEAGTKEADAEQTQSDSEAENTNEKTEA